MPVWKMWCRTCVACWHAAYYKMFGREDIVRAVLVILWFTLIGLSNFELDVDLHSSVISITIDSMCGDYRNSVQRAST